MLHRLGIGLAAAARLAKFRVGVQEGDMIQADSTGLPVMDGSQLTNVNSTVKTAIYTYQLTEGTDAGSWNTSAFTKVPLATELSDPSTIGSISSNVVTLEAGTYLFFGLANMSVGGSDDRDARLRIQNTSDAATIGLSINQRASNVASQNTSTNIIVIGQEVIAGSKNYELQGFASGACTFGTDDTITAGVEVYATLVCMQVAS